MSYYYVNTLRYFSEWFADSEKVLTQKGLEKADSQTILA